MTSYYMPRPNSGVMFNGVDMTAPVPGMGEDDEENGNGPAPPRHPGQQWPVRARRAQRAPRAQNMFGPVGGIDGLRMQHYAAQNQAIAGANAAIGKEMDNRRKVAAQQRDMQFKSQEAEKNRQHQMKMAQMQPQRQQQMGSSLSHGHLNVLEPLLTGKKRRRVGNSGSFSVGERVGNILDGLL